MNFLNQLLIKMNNLLTEAQNILANNRSTEAASALMTREQRLAMADDCAANKRLLSASHFHPDAEKKKEFEKMFWDGLGANKQ